MPTQDISERKYMDQFITIYSWEFILKIKVTEI